jgi:hypothetical protein
LRKAARKDSAVHVSLSSDSLFKQPGTLRLRRPQLRPWPRRWPRKWPERTVRAKAQKPAPSTRGREHGHEHGPMFGHRVNSEGLRGRAIAPGGSAPKKGYIGVGRRFCQPFRRVKQAQETEFCAVFRGCAFTPETLLRRRFATRADTQLRHLSAVCAALRPHSSAVLW